MLRARGKRVEVQNYIDNTGVQVADVVAGFHYLEHKSPAEVAALIADPAVRFDYYCWDLYARTSAHFKDQPDALAWRNETLHAIEADTGSQAEMAGCGRRHRPGTPQNHAAPERRIRRAARARSEILHLKFWALRVRAAQGAQKRFISRRKEKNKGWLGDARRRVFRGFRRQQSDRAIERDGHLRG